MRRIVISMLFITFTINLFAQNESEQQLFNQGVNAYQNGKYRVAERSFFRILQEYPRGRLTTATRLMLAKSYYKLNDFAKTEVICKYFFNKHPESDYLDDMHHLLGNTMYKLGKYQSAISEWAWVLENGDDNRLKRTDAEYIYQTMDHFLTQSDIEQLRNKFPGAEFQGLVTIALAKKMMEEGETELARSRLRTFLGEQPDHIYADEARRLLGSPGAVRGFQNSILYLKPAEGPNEAIAGEIEQGMKYALIEYQQSNPNERLTLRTKAIETNVTDALTVTNQQLVGSNPFCIVGPIDDDQCAALSLLSKYEQRPFVIPLSSQAGLTRLSPYAFQLNPDVRTKGRFLGKYATEQGFKRIATLAPANSYGEDFVQSFTEEVQAGGGEVVSVQWFYETTEDFSAQFQAIRRKGFYITFRDSVMAEDSTIAEEALKKKFREYMDKKFEPRRPGLQVDSTDVPSTGIDALLIVIPSSGFIQFVASQFAFNNIQTTLLGNEGWNDIEELQKYKQHIEGLIYITAGYYDPNSTDYRLFMNRFRSEMNTTPEKFHLLGYDIMRWILSNYQPGISPQKLKSNLENTNAYKGIIENIQFTSTPRVNSKLTLLKLNLGQLIKLN